MCSLWGIEGFFDEISILIFAAQCCPRHSPLSDKLALMERGVCMLRASLHHGATHGYAMACAPRVAAPSVGWAGWVGGWEWRGSEAKWAFEGFWGWGAWGWRWGWGKGGWSLGNGVWGMESGEWSLGNGVWGMESGEWSLGNGVWGMESGEWSLGNGVWGMESGEWSLGNGVWGMESGEWSLGMDRARRRLGAGDGRGGTRPSSSERRAKSESGVERTFTYSLRRTKYEPRHNPLHQETDLTGWELDALGLVACSFLSSIGSVCGLFSHVQS